MIINTTVVTALFVLIFLGCGNESIRSKQKIDEKTINVPNESTSKEKITELKSEEELEDENLGEKL